MHETDKYQITVIVLEVIETRAKAVAREIHEYRYYRQADENGATGMPGIPAGEELEYVLRESRVYRVWIQQLSDAEYHDECLNCRGDRAKRDEVRCRLAQQE